MLDFTPLSAVTKRKMPTETILLLGCSLCSSVGQVLSVFNSNSSPLPVVSMLCGMEGVLASLVLLKHKASKLLIAHLRYCAVMS